MTLYFGSILAVIAGTAAGAADPCACKYESGLPEAFWKGGKYAALAMVPHYGTVCAAWDSVPATPWYSDYCDTAKGKDYCKIADSWCDDSWCYVDKACSTWKKTDVFKDVAGAPADLGYSYKSCGSMNCYDTNSNGNYAAGCPFDQFNHCPDPCACKYTDSGLPEQFWKGGKYESKPMVSQYGAHCAAWDKVIGTPYYDEYVKGKDLCHKDNSWAEAAWCYVDSSCPSFVKTDVFADGSGASALGYSYDSCGSTNCYTNKEAAGCPYDPSPEGKCCNCKYGQGLPEAFWSGGTHKDLPMISEYGTVCGSWDSTPGTPWYGSCDKSKGGVDYCGGQSWCNDPWCYVDKDTCNSWVKTEVFKTSKDPAAATLGYSYRRCGALNCYANSNAAGCPYDPSGECDTVTCATVKTNYKNGKCCGKPNNKIRRF